MSKPGESYHAYMRGFRDGAATLAMRPEFTGNTKDWIRTSYEAGYTAGVGAQRAESRVAARLSGYEPTIMRLAAAPPPAAGLAEALDEAAEMRGRVLFAGKVQEIIGERQREEQEAVQRHGVSTGGAAASHAYESLAYVARMVQAALAPRPARGAGEREGT